jgi:uncharacterized NAD(P)/FAD-binding protein YdhS
VDDRREWPEAVTAGHRGAREDGAAHVDDMTAGPSKALRLAVIGGGFTGAALVIHTMRTATRPLDIDIVEPASELGRGIAYGTIDPAHRINVPSDRMSLFREDPDHLTRWLIEKGRLPDVASTDSRGHHYVARSAFGSYVLDTLARTMQVADPRKALRHYRARAVAICSDGAGWAVELSSGERLAADKVALCIGHSNPALPCPVSSDALRHPGFVRNPWAAGALSAIGAKDSVLVVGTGLTMADVIATMSDAGHRGPVTAISRRGLLARPHGLFRDDFDILQGEPAPDTALGLLRLLRRQTRQYGGSLGWHPVVDGLRVYLRQIWPDLPPREQRRVARRLLPFWDVHRFRIAPRLHDLVEDWRRRGQLVVEQAGLASLDIAQGKLVATLRRRDARPIGRSFDAVVLCTGPGNALKREPLIAQLVDRGLARPDGVGAGLAVDRESRLISRAGAPQTGLLALGPLTRGSFGEMTGAPDIARQIERIAAAITATS